MDEARKDVVLLILRVVGLYVNHAFALSPSPWFGATLYVSVSTPISIPETSTTEIAR